MNLLLLKTSIVAPKNKFCRKILGRNTNIKFHGNLLSLKTKCNDSYIGRFRKKKRAMKRHKQAGKTFHEMEFVSRNIF
jgi:hypothetical protein